jgi:hypothetical protein
MVEAAPGIRPVAHAAGPAACLGLVPGSSDGAILPPAVLLRPGNHLAWHPAVQAKSREAAELATFLTSVSSVRPEQAQHEQEDVEDVQEDARRRIRNRSCAEKVDDRPKKPLGAREL